jgi:hypothetical protein
MPSRWSRCAALHLIIGALLVIPDLVAGAPSDDAWVAGYAAAILERELNVRAPSLQVRDGVITIDTRDVPSAARRDVIAALERIRGVQRVAIAERSAPGAVPTAPPPYQTALGTSQTTPGIAQAVPATSPRGPNTVVGSLASGPALEPPALGFLPRGRLFQPLLADPRWPRMTAAYRYSLRSSLPELFAAGLGETVAFYRDAAGDDGRHGYWEMGVQGGVFSIFDLDSSSLDLINSDFIAAIFGAYRYGAFSVFTRVSHQSSHLGDELLLRETAPRRINLSFEAFDVRLSYDLPHGLRAYGGAGYLIRVDPEDLGRGLLQAGGEWRSPEALSVWRARLRPVAGVHLQLREMSDWHTDLSLRAGLQLDSGSLAGRSLQLLLEYYNGRSLDGQFFKLPVEYVGLGLHFSF